MINSSDEDLLVESKYKRILSRKWYIIAGVLALIVGFFAGYLVSFAIHRKSTKTSTHDGSNDQYHQMINNGITADVIKDNLRSFTQQSHRAGGPHSKLYAEQIAKTWKSFGDGIDVEIKEYDVMLSEPKKSGRIQVIDETLNKTLFTSSPNETVLIPEEEIDHVVPYNAYSASGNVKEKGASQDVDVKNQGELVYVNYGTLEDFDYLKRNHVDLKGKILICRYGKIFRANKVVLAELNGAVGVVLYNDPHDYSLGSVKYPQTWWLPSDGVQRGTVNHLDADPQTVGYPAIDGIYRIKVNETNTPKIPVHPISYSDAYNLLKEMDGIAAPKGWQGDLNITYKLNMASKNKTFRLTVDVENKPNSKLYNVIGKIKGNIEPDRLVLLGNHHDAWVMGALDPTAGTAVLTNIVKSFAEALKNGWKPRRTILFCSWDAEEFGLIGSTEWIEDNENLLRTQVVAYLNGDSIVKGNFTLSVKASSQIASTVFEAAKKMSDPDDKKAPSLYDTWTTKTPEKTDNRYPRIRIPGSGSDFKTFFVRYGIPVTNMEYTYDWDVVGHISGYPTYHSLHDTFYYATEFVDPQLVYSETVGKLWSSLATTLIDAETLPYNFTDYARRLTNCHNSFVTKHNESFTGNVRKAFAYITSAVKDFSQAANAFHKLIETLKGDSLTTRRINDIMMNVERSFISSQGISKERPYVRHVLYGPSKYNDYVGGCFPALIDDFLEMKYMNKTDEDQILKDVSTIYYHILQAAKTFSL